MRLQFCFGRFLLCALGLRVPVSRAYIGLSVGIGSATQTVFTVTVITSDKGGCKCVCPRLSVCLLARLLRNACIYLDEMLRVDRCRHMDELINF